MVGDCLDDAVLIAPSQSRHNRAVLLKSASERCRHPRQQSDVHLGSITKAGDELAEGPLVADGAQAIVELGVGLANCRVSSIARCDSMMACNSSMSRSVHPRAAR